MADDDAAFENLKKEIRSVLLPFKDGCTLFQFRKEYKSLIGRAIPAEKFKFRDDIDLLENIPDVVDFYQRGHEWILTAVADDSTWHIQKMVACQKKSAKVKSSRSAPRFSRYAPKSTYATSRQSSRTSRTPYSSQSYGSRQQQANSNFSWSHNGTSYPSTTSYSSTFASNPAPAVRQSSAASNYTPSVIQPQAASNYTPTVSSQTSITQPPAASIQTTSVRQHPAASNYTPAVSNQTASAIQPPATSNYTPAVSNQTTSVSQPPATSNQTASRQSSAASNSTPAASNQAPAVSRQSSNPSHFVSNSSSVQGVSNGSNGLNFSRQFQKNLPPRFRALSNTSSTTLLPPEVECKIVDVVRKYSTGLRMKDFFKAYQNNFNEEFVLLKHNFKSLQECLETIPDLSLRPSANGGVLIFYEGRKAYASGATAASKAAQSSESEGGAPFKFNGAWNNPPSIGTQVQSHNASSQNQYQFNPNIDTVSFNFQEQSQTSEKPHYYKDLGSLPKTSPSSEAKVSKSKADALDNFELNDMKVSSLGLTVQMKSKLREIISRNKQGIRAMDFPRVYESVTGSQFDLHSLGFTNLADLVDSQPDIMHRGRVEGSGKDWLIIPAHGYQEPENNIIEGQPQKAALQIELCIQNTRMILEGYPEGIPLNDFLNVYSVNCNEPLYIVDLGFDNIENFLLSIMDRVPLMIKTEKGVKTIFLDQVKAESMLKEAEMTIQEEILPEAIPFDAASPDCEYKKLVLPLDIGTSNFIPVYTSEIISPGQLFIQLVGEDTSEALFRLSDQLEEFYNGPHSDYYMVQDRHIKVGAMCASRWPKDGLWYRARIIAVKTPEIARVFYVDYGTSDDVPISLLRYLKETFSKLPAQAIKASLAHLKPPNKALVWNPQAKKRMLELCRDVLLMARVEEKKDDILYIILCDTSKGDKEEVYINDTLMIEGYAVSAYERDDPEPVPLQQVQVPVVDTQTIEKCLYQAMTKAMTDLALNYPGSMPNQLLSSPAAYQSAFGAMSNQLAQSMLGTPNNQIPGPYQPSMPGQSFPAIPGPYQGQPMFNALNAGQAMFGNNQPGSYQGQISAGASGPPGFSAARFDAGQLAAGAMASQFPPGFGPYQPSAPVDPERNSQSLGSDDNESDLFEDDDDDFDEFLKKSSSVSKRYVKRVHTDDGYLFHILIVDGQLYVSSGDISTLIWCLNSPDYLLTMLQSNDKIFESRFISEEGNEMMFRQFEQFHVKGIQQEEETPCLIIYPLQSTMKILNEYGHPSVELRQHIVNEMESFNPDLPFWQELSEMEIPDPNETFPAMSDEEKDNKRCLYELKLAKEGIRVRMDQLRKLVSADPSKAQMYQEEMHKHANLNQRVELRIAQIQRVVSAFS